MKPETIEMLKNKIEFVDALDKSVSRISGVDSVVYEVYVHPEREYKEEFVRVNFPGGGFCVRCCTGNSLVAILKEVGKIACGGYYEDLDFYNRIKNESEYVDFWKAI